MTREEAIELIGNMKSDLVNHLDDNDLTALDMAISALEKNESAEEWYKLLCEKWDEGDVVCNFPKGITNREALQALLPQLELVEIHNSRHRFFLKGKESSAFDLKAEVKWLNAPYKGGK